MLAAAGRLLPPLFASLLAWLPPAYAATLTWDGEAGPDPSDQWTNGLNWDSDGPPEDGDTVIVPGGFSRTRLINTFDLHSVEIRSPFRLSGNLTVSQPSPR